ncbi:unnamed protein product [Toxocara canis]|uniref:Cohesin domain-containing protein n=1 Tax=Toxocara canis TaxID=6265 RepID=A0A183U361_TOXCA|nr:unnamed protein product [Toxocara canis]
MTVLFALIRSLFQIGYLALLVWSALVVPAAKEQPLLPITMQPYSTSDQIANVYVQNTTIDLLSKIALPELVDETIRAQNPGASFDLTVSNNVSAQILVDTIEQGSRAFGIHNPVGFRQDFDLAFYSLVAMFDNYGVATPPLALSIADSAILRAKINRSISIQVSNHPLPPTIADSLKNKMISSGPALVIGYAVVIAMSMVVSGYAYFLIRESKTNSKHMQVSIQFIQLKILRPCKRRSHLVECPAYIRATFYQAFIVLLAGLNSKRKLFCVHFEQRKCSFLDKTSLELF